MQKDYLKAVVISGIIRRPLVAVKGDPAMEDKEVEVVEQVEQAAEATQAQAEAQAAIGKVAELQKEVEALRRQLAAERAKSLIEAAKTAGKLIPAMLVEGSPYIELAERDPDLFARLLEFTPARIAGGGSQLRGFSVAGEIASEAKKDDEEIDKEKALVLAVEEIARRDGVDFAEALKRYQRGLK